MQSLSMFLQFYSLSSNSKWVYHKIHVHGFLFKIFDISLWISLSFLRNCNMWRYYHILLILAFIYMVLMLLFPLKLCSFQLMENWCYVLSHHCDPVYSTWQEWHTAHRCENDFVITFLGLACSIVYYKTVFRDSCHHLA